MSGVTSPAGAFSTRADRFRQRGLAVGLVTAVGLTAGCSVVGGGSDDGSDDSRSVVLVTHDSFSYDEEVVAAFERESGIDLDIRQSGDAGELTNSLVLSRDNPIGDVAFGVDSTFAGRALAEGVFEDYRSPRAERGADDYRVADSDALTAIDVGDVCLNIDREWFAESDVPAPTGLDDLLDPAYRDLLVVQDPATSSPGLAFLLATIAHAGEDGWRDYWTGLRDNGVRVTGGWTEAYTQDFSGSSGNGPRPIVVSYASSPAAEIGADGTPRTEALLDTCYQQVEYAGVLAGTDRPEDARAVVDFLLSEPFQAQLAEYMYVYPVRADVELPEAWREAAPLPEESVTLPADEVEGNRDEWVSEWRDLVLG
ncbi:MULTISPECIES: thiamine ABC transporter substrate-binding protein [Actinoalloteichus]|uniref:Thiamine transport system substrate-binding protein n=1 Tax=Actinoalloteichus caeruleus DSM 43889 TaxID=1120930 RepID=A0ABT1JKR1_ACTCY|nr:thiamine ABC transporter substrate-binding protein [Actinoalloteichus caeruleus]MCP2332321.1 thiamine transport system substrate-binding protein [Actinoalloteichus caeruleus DSM 43889]